MDRTQRTYISYLLRLYRVRSGEVWIWRASLEDPLSGERRNFPDLPALFAFLEAEAHAVVLDEEPPGLDRSEREQGGLTDE